VDAEGRPYFLWDMDVTLDRFRELLRDGGEEQRAYLLGKLMRQAKPDDVFTFVTLAEVRRLFPHVRRYLGRTLGFWEWLLEVWKDDRAA
jgi:hypothetical protein